MIEQLEVVERTARATFGEPPAWRFFVPGRLEVFGKHTDYAGGRSLVAAVPRGFAVATVPADDGRVTVVDARSTNSFSGAADRTCAGPARWHTYVAAVVRRLALNFPDASLSTRIALVSDLPSAAGISSSSALVIAIAEALIARGGIEETAAWRQSVRSPEDRAGYFGCIENGSSFRELAGERGVGTQGGSEDHAAIVMSGAGHLQQFSFAPLQLDRRVTVPAGWTFVIASTGVRASKTGAALEKYNRLSTMAAEIVTAWRRRHPLDTRTLGALVRHGEDVRLDLSGDLQDRLEHFAREDARVLAAADAFARGDLDTIGRLADASQEDAARLLGNQVPETMALASGARALGAAAASGFGAGWGGSVWALVPEGDAQAFLARWVAEYRRQFPYRTPDAFVAPPADGVRRFQAG